jgi:hypothetical protein
MTETDVPDWRKSVNLDPGRIEASHGALSLVLPSIYKPKLHEKDSYRFLCEVPLGTTMSSFYENARASST